MKKILLSVFTVAAAFAANAQCTPNPSLFSPTIGGKILPDTAAFNYTSPNFDSTYLGQEGQNYNVVFYIKTLTDTTSSGVAVQVEKIKFLGLTGGPTGTTVVTDVAANADTWVNGGSQAAGFTPVFGCATISIPGSSLADSVYQLTLKVDLYLHIAALSYHGWFTALPGLGDPNGVQFSGYKLNAIAAGIEELNTANLNLVVYPNPFSDVTNVSYSLKNANKVSILVTDVTGKVLRTANLDGKAGINQYTFAKENLQNGIYFINLTSGENTITKKVSIQ